MRHILSFLLFLFLIECAGAYGIGAAPASMHISISNDSIEQRQIYVFNPNDFAIDYEIKHDLPHWINLSENKGEVASGKWKSVILSIDPKQIKPGNYNSTITIYPEDKGSSLSLISGAKIDVNIEVGRYFSLISKTGKKTIVGSAVLIIVVIAGVAVIIISR